MYFFDKSSIVKMISLVILSATAHSALAKPPLKEKYDVLKQASSYARSSACMTTFDDDAEDNMTTIRDVHLIDSETGFDEEGEIGTKYIVYWGGDVGCSGGSGTYSNYLTSFSRYSESRPFLVDRMNILDDINEESYKINERFIEDVEFYNGVLLITSSDYSEDGTDGGNNFPRYKYRYTVVYNENKDQWILANKELIKDKYPNAKNGDFDEVVVFEEPYL